MAKRSDWMVYRIKENYYASSASFIREILWFLPLTQSAIGGKGIFASIPLRGEIVSLLDLRLFWGEDPSPYSVGDSLLLVEGNLAFPISEVLEVVSWEDSYFTENKDDKGILEERVYKGKVISLLDLTKFYPQELIKKPWESERFEKENQQKSDWYNVSYMCFSDTDKAVLKRRLASFKMIENSSDIEGMDAISIVRSGEEDFGIPLGNVIEFSDPLQLTPVPGLPPILYGCMNLRGDVIPVVSLSEIFGQIRIHSQFSGKVVILKEENVVFGLLVDELVDVVYKKKADKLPAPLSAKADGGSLLDASYSYDNRYVNVINIPSLYSHTIRMLG